MITTDAPATVTISRASVARILADTDAHLVRILSGSQSFEARMISAWWHLEQAGRDLDRLAAHTQQMMQAAGHR